MSDELYNGYYNSLIDREKLIEKDIELLLKDRIPLVTRLKAVEEEEAYTIASKSMSHPEYSELHKIQQNYLGDVIENSKAISAKVFELKAFYKEQRSKLTDSLDAMKIISTSVEHKGYQRKTRLLIKTLEKRIKNLDLIPNYQDRIHSEFIDKNLMNYIKRNVLEKKVNSIYEGVKEFFNI